MTQIDELYPQIDTILNQLINIACDYEQGKDVDLDAKANETNHALQALIATQIQEARESIADEIGKFMEIQGANGTWNYDSYMHGMYNGMELCHAFVKGVEPKYRNAPKQWLADIPMPTDAEPSQDIVQLRSTPNE